MISASANQLVPSSQRPVPLQARTDLVIKRIEYRGVGSWVVKDPVGLKYHRLQAEQYATLQLIDGNRSLEQIRDELKRRFPTITLNLADVQALITDLHRKGLVFSQRMGQGPSYLKQKQEERKKKVWKTLRSILYIRLPGWDPERTLQWLYPLVRWVFRPWAVTAAALFVLSSWVLLMVQFDVFRSKLPEFEQFFGWPNLIYMWVTLGVAKVIHEFGHGVSCKHFGGECHEMGIMLLVFSPCLYCDVTDSWLLKNKWKRIIIAAAGMYIEVILSALAIFGWWYTTPGLINALCLNVFFVTAVTTVIFNANPLMRFDGYYMLADWLEIPNLRPKADKMLREKFAWYCLGIESRPDPFMPETGRGWFVLFAIAAALYRWFILFGITIFLYTVLKPYNLQSIGITLAVVSLASIVGSLLYNLYSIIKAPRAEPLSKPKIFASLAIVALIVAGVLTIPLPLHIESTFLIQPNDVRHIYVSTPGRLVDVNVTPGAPVDDGAVLVRLNNLDKQGERISVASQMKAQQFQVAAASVLDPAQELLARKKLESLQTQLAELDDQIAQLTLRAPCDGTVVAPPRTPAPTLAERKEELPTWYGTPLDPKNFSTFLDEGAHVLSIAPNEKLDAVLLIDQVHRNDVRVGQRVEIKFGHLPDRTYTGKIVKISERQLDYAPESLSNKAGGELPTVTDPQGRERLISAVYQATVVLDQDTQLLKSGMRGRSRFLVDRRTTGSWLYRYLRRTFLFRL